MLVVKCRSIKCNHNWQGTWPHLKNWPSFYEIDDGRLTLSRSYYICTICDLFKITEDSTGESTYVDGEM